MSIATPPSAPTPGAAGAPAASPVSAPAERILLFKVGERLYGCDIDDVREIIPWRRATRMPGAPGFVLGLVNLRGTLVTVADLAVRLDPAAPPGREGSIVLVERGSKLLGVRVDEMLDVQPLPAERVDRAAADQSRGGAVRGVGHLEDGTVVILIDMQSLVRQVLL